MIARRVLLSFLSATFFWQQVHGLSPAWNGQLLPGAVPDPSDPAIFVPYYVPPGSYSIDDTSPDIRYSASFDLMSSHTSINGTQHVTGLAASTAQFTCTGTGIEWFGYLCPSCGIATVYIDGNLSAVVDAYAPKRLNQQRLARFTNLSHEPHTVLITVSGKHNPRSTGNDIYIDAFVISRFVRPVPQTAKRDEQQDVIAAKDPSAGGPVWKLVQKGETGVAAMQLAIVSDKHAIILDKVEHNLLDINGHPAWGALYDLQANTLRSLNVKSNSFCAGGTWLSNGTLLSIGGNPVVESKTASADFGDVNGLQAIRMFNPCDDGSCDILEAPNQIRMASPRWYNSATRLDDGSVMIIGGSTKGGWMNNKTTNNPTIEFYPPKNLHGRNGFPIELPFLSDTLNSNLFPIAFTLPDGRIFIAANRDAMIYDWVHNSEQRLPQIPNGVRVTYPMTGTGLLLPLSPSNNYTAEILLCGGSTIDDTRAGYDISSDEQASSQCSRLVLSESGIQAGWSVEEMPDPRIMPDAVLLPTGSVVIINGGRSGIAGYGNVKGQVGQSNAKDPVLQPVLYNSNAPLGKRFSSEGMPRSETARLYHSVASLTPDGSIMIAGSNPNLDRSDVEYATEYRVEWLFPPYMSSAIGTSMGTTPAVQRPGFTKKDLPSRISFGKQFMLPVVGIPIDAKNISVSLMDLGFVTHGVHMNSRLVFLTCSLSPDRASLIVSGPPSGGVYPPGPGWLYVVVDGVPSVGRKVMVGDGAGPPVDDAAIRK
ncbi:copper radical oxidase [Clavulina sp. PMI_390]|nr:copper radical oxidase [Clavulina sp. PMI_390]